jgi:hypothetical protein
MKKLFNLLAASAIFSLLSITAHAQQVYVANLSPAQEVPATGTNGTGSTRVTLNAAETAIDITVTYSGLSSAANAGHIHGPAPVGVNTGIQIGFAGVGGTAATINITNQPVTAEQVQWLRSGLLYVNIHTGNFPNGEIRGQLKIADKFGDYDGDGRFDIGVYRHSVNTFFIQRSLDNGLTSQQWGQPGDSPMLGDYDGDGRTDFTVVRDVNDNLTWFVLQSSNNSLRVVQWGLANNDIPVAGDYDGDGKADIGVWRSNNATWYIQQSSNGALLSQQWGIGSDDPGRGDFDKDGKTDFLVIRNNGSTLTWYALQSSNGAVVAIQWGLSGDEHMGPLQPDFDLDGRTDLAVWRPSNGTWYIRQSSNGALVTTQFGQLGDFAATADIDGDGKADLGAIRITGSNYVWYALQSSNGALKVVQWGLLGDEPV